MSAGAGVRGEKTMQITAAMVKALREKTGVGMMECKKFLAEAGGDMDRAVELLRKSGQARADRKGGRAAAEGVVLMESAADGAVVMLEANCETDFVAKDEQFTGFCRKAARAALEHAPADLEALAQLDIGGATVEAARLELVSRIGENIQLRRFLRVQPAGERCGAYLHGTRIGVVVEMDGGDDDLARDVAMHIAASRPLCLSEDDAPAGALEREREILTAQAGQTGKPADIVARIVEGRLQKYLQEIALLKQPFVRDEDQSVGQLLKRHSATVRGFHRYEVGEGIEKKKENFAEEVMAQVQSG